MHVCSRCRGRIYSLLTAETTDTGPVCIICQRRALKASSGDSHGLELTVPENRHPQPPHGPQKGKPEAAKPIQLDLFGGKTTA